MPTPENLRVNALCAEIRSVAMGIVRQRRADRLALKGVPAQPAESAGGSSDGVAAPTTLLDMLLDANDGGESLSDEDVVDQAATFMLAGAS